MRRLRFANTGDFYRALDGFVAEMTSSSDVSKPVADVLGAVREEGDKAVLRYTERFDGARLRAADLRVTADALERARRNLAAGDLDAIREAIRCVNGFHDATLPRNWETTNPQGATVGERYYPIGRVGLYIPGGRIPLVSTVVMTAALAKRAGCPEIAVCTPPLPDGSVAEGMLAALELIGVSEVYKVGGVQAIGAMAYGTATIPRVDKVFGPGNAFVMEAKRQVYGTAGVDLLPGPSEVMVIADGGARPDWVAMDLLAQAEHGSGKEIVYLVALERGLVDRVRRSIERLLPTCAHAEACREVVEQRFMAIEAESLEAAAAAADRVAPEHLELQVADESLAPLTERVTTAGAILQGYRTPTALGDFTAGPSHTLPTGGAGRFCSGLRATDFMRRSSVVRYDASSVEAAAPTVDVFARLEGLDAHGASVRLRAREEGGA